MPAKITPQGIQIITSLFNELNLKLPLTLSEWPLEYARDVSEYLRNYEAMYGWKPSENREHLMQTVNLLGVYGPLSEMTA